MVAAAPNQALDLAALRRLQRVAKNQRGIMLCILAQLAVAAAGRALGFPSLLQTGLALVVGVASLVFTILLAREVFSMVGVVVCVVLLLAPYTALVLADAGPVVTLLSLLTLLVINQRATKELQAAGFKVGLLGGNPADVEARIGQQPHG